MKAKIWTPEELGPETIHMVVPAGIGDISWIYSKIRHLKQILGRPILVQLPDELPQRGGNFIQLLPDVYWGGHLSNINSWRVLSQAIPGEWPLSMGWGPLLPRGYPINISANIWLECGHKLSDWISPLPTDYHYPMAFPQEDIDTADRMINALPRPIFTVYVSNREKDSIKAGGWSLWSVQQWAAFLESVAQLSECAGASFVCLGASWDKDKTDAISAELEQEHTVCRVVAQPLAVALRCLQRSNYCFSYPSGIGIVANVLRTPGLMLLPWLLKGLETSYADPFDMSLNRYRAWADPSPEDAFRWFKHVSMPQILAENGGSWPAR